VSFIVTGLPRSGTSLVAQLVASAGYKTSLSGELLGAAEFNSHGYHEDVLFNLLNDQLLRSYYSDTTSFLNPPSMPSVVAREDFYYDIDADSLDLPPYYLENIHSYCPCGWDSWGLSRMTPGSKWYKCYSDRNIADIKGILNSLNRYSKQLKSDPLLCLKDPRFLFTYDKYDLCSTQKVILVQRDYANVLRSMRYHYGNMLFTDNKYPETEWVCNHFNSRVPPVSFESYCSIAESWTQTLQTKYNVLMLCFEDLLAGTNLFLLEDFIGQECDFTLINS